VWEFFQRKRHPAGFGALWHRHVFGQPIR
jgi:hypothetical protein